MRRDYLTGIIPKPHKTYVVAFALFDGDVQKTKINISLGESEQYDESYELCRFIVERIYINSEIPVIPNLKLIIEIRNVISLPQKPTESRKEQVFNPTG